ncbi:hypothetical protein M0R36_10555 [bacterium]|jgi:hypothetical protein|nr:hypothetical protein [bacterium]
MVGFIALILTFILGYSYLPVDYYVTATFKSNIIHGEFTKEQHTITAIKGVRNYFPDTEPEVRLMINGDSIKLHEKVHMYDLPNNLKWERIDDK